MKVDELLRGLNELMRITVSPPRCLPPHSEFKKRGRQDVVAAHDLDELLERFRAEREREGFKEAEAFRRGNEILSKEATRSSIMLAEAIGEREALRAEVERFRRFSGLNGFADLMRQLAEFSSRREPADHGERRTDSEGDDHAPGDATLGDLIDRLGVVQAKSEEASQATRDLLGCIKDAMFRHGVRWVTHRGMAYELDEEDALFSMDMTSASDIEIKADCPAD
jgi:hypothetical protein